VYLKADLKTNHTNVHLGNIGRVEFASCAAPLPRSRFCFTLNTTETNLADRASWSLACWTKKLLAGTLKVLDCLIFFLKYDATHLDL
jgi:hypothetical protein